MSQEYELTVLERDGLVYTKIELATIGAQAPIWWDSGVGAENQQTNAPTSYDRFKDKAAGWQQSSTIQEGSPGA